MRRSLLLALACIGFLVNPGVGCSPGEGDADFHFGAAEMKAAVEGTWELTLSDSTKLTLTLAQGDEAPTTTAQRSTGFVRPAMACGSRTLVKSANACMDTTSMPLDVAITNGDPVYSQGRLRGSFMSAGTEFRGGSLNLTLASLSLSAAVSPEGNVTGLYGFVEGGVTPTSLARIAK